MPLLKGQAVPSRSLSYLLAWPFAADRLDAWVLNFSIGIVVVCIAGVGLWQLFAYLAGKRPKKVRESPEPPSAPSPKLSPRRDDPEKLQQACGDLENSLAEAYLELAQHWLRKGQPQQAAAALKRIVQLFPERRQAQVAQDRLRELDTAL
jgi:hypothetical protein